MADRPPSDEHPLHHRAATLNDLPSSAHANHGISIQLPDGHSPQPPSPARHISDPSFQSPLRQHKRTPSRTRGVKETLNARSSYGSGDDDGAAVHKINQYTIKQEIGRGSFGAVHLAVDQYGTEFAVKEFSKSRLRKRAQSNLLRRPNQPRRSGHLAAGMGFNSPLHRVSQEDRQQQSSNPLSLIKEEIAIMKKLNHTNVVSLYEVLDDPEEDSLYMVMEMCKKGVVMKVGLEERAVPYDEEACRYWFRDLILGIEYLHAQGIVHRDIKPDNCLITEDDVLKIVDFGVSEMFERESDMSTTKSAGSPAFMPPELCVARHGAISGRAADIWSMGVTLYCLRYGHIPFEKTGVLELYESIRSDDIPLDEEKDDTFADLMRRILCKDPAQRITMEDLRQHPWVTKRGADSLLSASENCADIVDPPTEAEVDHAITGNMAHLMVVMKAVKRFKSAVDSRKSRFKESWLGRDSRIVAPPSSMGTHAQDAEDLLKHPPVNTFLVDQSSSHIVEQGKGPQSVTHDMGDLTVEPTTQHGSSSNFERRAGETDASYSKRLEEASEPAKSPPLADISRARTFPVDAYAKGHAHDPLEDTLYLNIGPNGSETEGGSNNGDNEQHVVSESPSGIDTNIYEQAYQDEMDRILARRQGPSVYLTRRVEHREDLRTHSKILDASKYMAREAARRLPEMADRAAGGFAGFVEKARSQIPPEHADTPAAKFAGRAADNFVGLTEKARARIPQEEAVGHSEIPLATSTDGGSDQSPSSNRSMLRDMLDRSVEMASPHVQATRETLLRSAEAAQPHIQATRDTLLRSADIAQPHIQSTKEALLNAWKQAGKSGPTDKGELPGMPSSSTGEEAAAARPT